MEKHCHYSWKTQVTPYINTYCVHISTRVTPQAQPDTCRTSGLCVLPCFWWAYCSVAFFVPRPRYRRSADSLIPPFHSYNFLKTWHFFLQQSFLFLFLLLSKDKLWKSPKMNHEKNLFLWIVLSSGDQFHLLIKDHLGIPLFSHKPVGQSVVLTVYECQAFFE